MSVLVEEVMTAKTGKSLRVKLGGTWYGAALDSGLNGAKGMMVEAEIQTGKYGPWINGWKATQNAVAAGNPPMGGSSPSAPLAAAAPYDERNPPPETHYAEPAKHSDNSAPWFWPSVSNVCAAAIEKGLITKPEELNMWALKWAQVAVSVKEVVR